VDWGDDRVELFRFARFWPSGSIGTAEFVARILSDVEKAGDWAKAVRDVTGLDPPAGVVVVRIGESGLTLATGAPRPAIAGEIVPIDVVLDSQRTSDVIVTLDGDVVQVAAGGVAVHSIEVDGGAATFALDVGGEEAEIGEAVYSTAAAQLRLHSSRPVRWSVTDASGGGWFPADCLRKWDVCHRPFFHGSDLVLDVPAGPLHLACTRGIEYELVEREVDPEAGGSVRVDCDPERLFDPRAEGWHGSDLHVHMNYGGDLVCDPHDAASMQLGEGLELVNFVAGNCQTSLVYDAETLEQFAGRDLPWSTRGTVARMGLEYRNDLLGHVVAVARDRVPAHVYSGHERSDHPNDWPPNKTACDELRSLGAIVVYPHPVFAAFPDDGTVDAFFANPRSVEARELVLDAALGAVDAVDVVSPFDDEGAITLYHHLLSCGLRLAATAGTDTFLFFSHGPGVASNPPGWCRVYAYLGDEELTMDAFKRAISEGRTVASNGPWVTLTVDGKGHGSVLDVSAGTRVGISARVRSRGVDQLTIVGAAGVIAESTGDIDTTLVVEEPTWLAAIARGPGNAYVGDVPAIAHTSPINVDIAGKRVAQEADARWCLRILDELGVLIAEHGHFDPGRKQEVLSAFDELLDEARGYYMGVGERAARRNRQRRNSPL
jgi:hypothetical protein